MTLCEIALLRRNHFGDLLCAMPLLLYLQQKHPLAKRTLFVDPYVAPLLPFLEGYDQVYFFSVKGNRYLQALSMAWQCRHQSFDLAIGTKRGPSNFQHFFLKLLRAKQTIFSSQEGQEHQALQCLKLITSEFSEVPSALWPRLKIPEKFELPPYEGKLFVISLRSRRERSTFPLEKWATLLNTLSRAEKFTAALAVLPSEKEYALQLQQSLKIPSFVVTAEFSDFLSLLHQADLVFSGDGGVMHLTAALDRPQVVFFGGTSIQKWAPLTNKGLYFYHPYDLSLLADEEIQAGVEAFTKSMNPLATST